MSTQKTDIDLPEKILGLYFSDTIWFPPISDSISNNILDTISIPKDGMKPKQDLHTKSLQSAPVQMSRDGLGVKHTYR